MGGLSCIVGIVRSLIDYYRITVPVALHLDHGRSYEICVEAIRAGFTSVMIDASHLGLVENIQITQKVVQEAHRHGVSVDASLAVLADGRMTSSSTRPQRCMRYLRNVSCGNGDGYRLFSASAWLRSWPLQGRAQAWFQPDGAHRPLNRIAARSAWGKRYTKRANQAGDIAWNSQNQCKYGESDGQHRSDPLLFGRKCC